METEGPVRGELTAADSDESSSKKLDTNTSSGWGSDGVPYDAHSHQPSTSKSKEEDSSKSRKWKQKSALKELVHAQNEIEEPPVKKKKHKKKNKKKDEDAR